MNLTVIFSKRTVGIVCVVALFVFISTWLSNNQPSHIQHAVVKIVKGSDRADVGEISSEITPSASNTVTDEPANTESENKLHINDSFRNEIVTTNLQFQKLQEEYKKVHNSLNRLKLVSKNPEGYSRGFNEDAFYMYQKQLFEKMGIDSHVIDEYTQIRNINDEPDLPDWDDIPPRLKMYAQFIFKVVPKEKDPNFKTPCWYRNGTLKCLPYFYILGMTKCGTSDLWNKTVFHPQVIDTPKEIHWWTHRFGNIQKGLQVSNNRQVINFSFKYSVRALSGIDVPDPSNGRWMSVKVLGDGSPSTLWNNKAWRQIYKYTDEPPYVNADVIAAVTPGAKLIVTLRDPVERLYSSYNFFNRNKKSTPENFHNLALQSLSIFEACMRRSGSLRGCTYQSTSRNTGFTSPSEFTGGIYYVYLSDWLRAFPREQILILELSEWHNDCETNLAKVYNFLELDPASGDIVRESCKQPIRRSPRKRTPRPMLMETRRLLEEKYRPFNEMLFDLLKDEKFHWSYDK